MSEGQEKVNKWSVGPGNPLTWPYRSRKIEDVKTVESTLLISRNLSWPGRSNRKATALSTGVHTPATFLKGQNHGHQSGAVPMQGRYAS